MIMAKCISSKKLIEHGTFKIKVGTMNKKQPKTFYIEMNCFAKLKDGCEYNDGTLKFLSLGLKKVSTKIAKERNLAPNTISNVELSEESLKNGKSAYLTVEMYFMQDLTANFNDVYDMSVGIVGDFAPLIEEIVSENNIECRKVK